MRPSLRRSRSTRSHLPHLHLLGSLACLALLLLLPACQKKAPVAGYAPQSVDPGRDALLAAGETELYAQEADELLIIEAEPVTEMLARSEIPRPRVKSRRVPIPDPAPEEPKAHDLDPLSTTGLNARDLEGKTLGTFPLRRTTVAAEISGPLARTQVRQEYGNPFSEVIEAVYVFPLPAKAAVTDFVLEAGGRRIVGLVRPRAEAERIYRQARARGQTASLLTQERPNLFTQSVANIEPGGEVTVELTFFERLVYRDGVFQWVFPTVVGPRYIPGTPQAAMPSTQRAPGAPGTLDNPAGGTAPPTDQVADAHRITPPILRPNEATGHRLDLTVTVEAPLPIRSLEVPSHRVRIDDESPTRRIVRLADTDDRRLDRDFVLRFALAGETTEIGLLAHRQALDSFGYFLLDVQPPVEPADDQVMAREITFLLDVSGSMSGTPMEISRRVVDQTLAHLRPDDVFNLFYFASGNGQLWPEARPGTRDNLAAARRFLDHTEGGGGTEMLAGVARALRGTHDPERLQMFVFLTDGFVGDEARILQLLREGRGEARFFAFGIGSSVNRYLIEGIGEHGGGSSQVVLPRAGEVERAASQLQTLIDAPVLVDLEIDWNGLPVDEIYPGELPDLYAGGTLELVGRYRLQGERRPARGTAVLSGRLGTRRVSYEIEVELPVREEAHSVLGPVWARHKIHDLSNHLLTAHEDEKPGLVDAITGLALEHRLASAYTSFVAVDETRIAGDGRPLRVLQPVELPEGLSYEGVSLEPPGGTAVSVQGWGMVLQQRADGGLTVAQLDAQGEAALSGVPPGARLTALDRVQVLDLVHLQSLLLQAGGTTVEVHLDPGGEVRLSRP